MLRSLSLVLAISIPALTGCRSTTGPQPRTATVQAFADRAAAAERQEDWKGASQFLDQAVQAAPRDANLQRRLATVQLASGQREDALKTLKRAVDLKPAGTEENAELAGLALQMGELSLADETLQRALSADKGNVKALMLKAEMAEQRNNPEEARAAYHRVLEESPRHSPAKLKLAVHEIEAGQPDQAAVLLRSVCECPLLMPTEKVDARRRLGLAYSRESRWEDAARELQAALDQMQQPEAADWHHLAEAYYQLGREADARRTAMRALEVDPEHRPSLRLMAAIDQTQSMGTPRVAATHGGAMPR